jgi:hypothetical protein
MKTTETMKQYLAVRKMIMEQALKRMPHSFTTKMFFTEMQSVEMEMGVICETPPYSISIPFSRTEGGHRVWSFDRPIVYLKTQVRKKKLTSVMIEGAYHWMKV